MYLDVVIFVTLATVLVSNLPFGCAWCCHKSSSVSYFCVYDKGRNMESCGNCCATGSCNAFCCECSGKCTYNCDPSLQYRRLRSITEYNNVTITPALIIAQADRDRDGLLSVDEALQYLRDVSGRDKETVYREVKLLDINRDGFISPGEIDSSVE